LDIAQSIPLIAFCPDVPNNTSYLCCLTAEQRTLDNQAESSTSVGFKRIYRLILQKVTYISKPCYFTPSMAQHSFTCPDQK
jgi:hypothetical protein